jgi:hypothetical protein
MSIRIIHIILEHLQLHIFFIESMPIFYNNSFTELKQIL